ncbi:hypothetical protein GLOTRDRAFT_126174 [Gloeophyllum trabeum ATCC 11539]|uniref:Alfy-like armadillo-like repeat domain-containing protein n=1 Tax=Gloeophyllum trabeum (strain ATCC 11539 / FP-39264 / Madison 617) TaxID=670483 RepID=S7QJK9_GLOTA|nr:uncharacterized protein GLOTRDRAFT_126174 [Gloeophyllum trabeum ATCC 11539]EPQ59881.1 hypothetical protein GLOTRDRAFT_126174 [Gloeophyllum trabeum ATCC 11539]
MSPPRAGAPEDFERDVLVELMRNGVERLKVAEDTHSRIETLSEIHRVTGEDRDTKDDGHVREPVDQVAQNAKGAARYMFTILSEVMFEHNANAAKCAAVSLRSVGYDSFPQVVEPLVLDPRTADWTLGLLVSLALHNFLLTTLFSTLRKTEYTQLTTKITDYQSEFWLAHLAGDAALHLCVYKILEQLAATSHRNKAVLSGMGILAALVSAGGDGAVPDEERAVKQKLLKRLMNMGTVRGLLHLQEDRRRQLLW